MWRVIKIIGPALYTDAIGDIEYCPSANRAAERAIRGGTAKSASAEIIEAGEGVSEGPFVMQPWAKSDVIVVKGNSDTF